MLNVHPIVFLAYVFVCINTQQRDLEDLSAGTVVDESALAASVEDLHKLVIQSNAAESIINSLACGT